MLRCPRCGSGNVGPVIYEYPYRSIRLERCLRDLETSAEGAPMDEQSPNWSCGDCEHAWPDQRRLETCRVLRFGGHRGGRAGPVPAQGV
jgi:hypothetical protein